MAADPAFFQGIQIGPCLSTLDVCWSQNFSPIIVYLLLQVLMAADIAFFQGIIIYQCC